jgi:hypothetical protein
MAIVGNTAYFCKGYSEGSASYAKFFVNKPGVKHWLNDKWRIPSLITYAVTADAENVYWANVDPPDTARNFVFATKTSNDADLVFSKGTGFTTKFGVAFKSVTDLLNDKKGKTTGLAVQKGGRFLLVAHAGLNEIHVVDKQTGELVQTVPIGNPSMVAMDATDNVWVCYTQDNAAVISKFSIAANGTLSPTQLSIKNVANPVAIAISPDNKYIVVADGGNSQQLKAFNNQTGMADWVYGKEGGYASDPTVSYDKFYFTDNRQTFNRYAQTFIAFQPDGSFWVGDPGNARTLHFSPERKYLDKIMYLPASYTCVADPNNPHRVFSDYLEFKVDYDKALKPNNGSWELVKNWGATVPDSLDAGYFRFASLTTLKNERTYALFPVAKTTYWELVELPAQGPLRFTGVKIAGFPATRLYKDGSLRTTPRAVVGKSVIWTEKKLAGFDNANDPQWGNEEPLAVSPPSTKEHPVYWGGGILRTGEITSSGILVSFDNGLPPHGGDGYHLGGIKLGDNKWLWKTAKVTEQRYNGEFPADGSYDIGNNVQYAGGIQLVDERNIFWGYHGEFWKSSQVNKWNHVWDDGLLVGQFGVTGADDPTEAPVGMAGNVFSASVAHINDSVIYLYHNDESYHSGMHRWKISGINTIKEQVVPIEIKGATAHGLLASIYDDTLLNNVDLKTAHVIPLDNFAAEEKTLAKNIASKQYSISLSGFITPQTDGLYSFYTGVEKGARLWVNGQLVVDNHTAGNKVPMMPGTYLSVGKRYPILLEVVNGGVNDVPVLSWSSNSISKQPVPSSQLTPSDENTQSPKVFDLMEGLQKNSTLENGVYGWTREPVDEDSTDRHAKWWNVRTSFKKFDKHLSPDVYILRRQGTGAAQVTRDFGDISMPLNNWELYGNLSFEKDFPNVGNSPADAASGGCYFEVLDNNGKVLLRVYTVVMHYWDDVRLYVNDKVVLQTNIDNFKKFVERSNRIDITGAAGKLSVKFGNLATVTVGSLESGGAVEHPQKMRVFFWGNGSNLDRTIDLEGFYFELNKP